MRYKQNKIYLRVVEPSVSYNYDAEEKFQNVCVLKKIKINKKQNFIFEFIYHKY